MEAINDPLIEELIHKGLERALNKPYFIIYSYFSNDRYDIYGLYPTKFDFIDFKTESDLKEALKSYTQDRSMNIKGVYKGNYKGEYCSFKKLDYEIIVNLTK